MISSVLNRSNLNDAMKRATKIRIAARIYRDPTTGNFYERPVLHGKQTWRKLSSTTLSKAKKELAAKRTFHAQAALGLARDPYGPKPLKLGELFTLYMKAGCPDRYHSERSGKQLNQELSRLKLLWPYW